MSNVLRVLLAEDSPEDKEFFVRGLQALDLKHVISHAENSTELFAILEREPKLDLIIIDIHMTGKDGITCLKEIKAHEKYKELPVIIMTSSKNYADIDAVFTAGAHYYAIKPYSYQNYIETLKVIFNVDWSTPQPIPEKGNFIINLAFV